MIRNALVGSIERNLEQIPSKAPETFIANGRSGYQHQVTVDPSNESDPYKHFEYRKKINNPNGVLFLITNQFVAESDIQTRITLSDGLFIGAKRDIQTQRSKSLLEIETVHESTVGSYESLSIIELLKIARDSRKARKIARSSRQKTEDILAKIE